MRREIRDKWTAALRSGDYKQGEGVLRDLNDNHCCLGVLCELAVAEGVIPPPVTSELDHVYAGDMACYLPETVQNWAGLTSQVGDYDDGRSTLTFDNDHGKTFAEIADIIEGNF